MAHYFLAAGTRMKKPWSRARLTRNQEPTAGVASEDGSTPADNNDNKLDSRKLAGQVSKPAINQLVLEVSGSGRVTSAPNNPNDGRRNTAKAGMSLDELLPTDMAAWVRKHVKRTLRGRQVHTAEYADAEDGRHVEFTFVTTGRDNVLLVSRDISERVSTDSRMQHLAYVDSVTGLPNREFLREELARLLDDLRLKEGRAALIFFDVDQVDLHGRTSRKPDAIMRELGKRLKEGLRRVNDPEPADNERYSVAARIDYRQFGIVLPDISSGEDAVGVAQRLSESLQQPLTIEKSEISVTVRAGISLFPQDGTDAETMFANAMTAMDDARGRHADSFTLHSGTVRMRALERRDLELELRTALDREEFDLNYLPIVDAAARSVVTAEALLRWPSALLGAKSIQRVVTLAEHTGLIVPIGNWVLRSGTRQVARWHDEGQTAMRLAVNLSVQEFSRPEFAESLVGILNDSGLGVEYLDLEITEHMLFRDAMKDFQSCKALKAVGVGIMLDDYGTGACSVVHLSRSPIDAVKIDNTFVANVASNDDDRAACAGMIAMAHELGMRVIAEGVETEEQAEILRGQGCDALQGFLFCKPLPASEFGQYLQRAAKAGAR